MKLRKIFRTAWEGLMLNKVRSFLTTLGVIIGVASVIVMLAISAGAEASIAEQINALGANLIIVSPMRGVPGAGRTLLIDDAYAIAEQVVGISGFSAEQSPAAQNVRAGGITLEAIPVIGTTADFPNVRDYAVTQGVYFSAVDDDRKAKVVVLGSGIATDLFGTESAIGQTVTVDSTKLTLIGVMEPKGIVAAIDYDGHVYMPINLLFQKFMTASPMGTDAVRTIYLKSDSQEQIDSVIAQTSAILAERHDVDPTKPDFTVQTQQDIIATQEATTAAFRDLLAWVAAILLLVGGNGIMNIMLVSVTERTREIGLRQALGAKATTVLMQFLIEAVILSLAGGLVGVILGIGASYLFGTFGTMRTEIVPLSIPLAFGAATIVGIFFGYFMKKIFLPLVFLFALLLVSCSGTAAPVSTTGSDLYVSQNLPVDYEGALAIRNQLALGTLELLQTGSSISAEQAKVLLPLWQALRSTHQAGGTAQAEVNALLTQIEATMKPEQLQSIAGMKLTFANMQEWATANGITMGSGGGVPGQGAGMPPEARAPKQAAEGVTFTSGGSGSKLSTALMDAVIASLQAQVS